VINKTIIDSALAQLEAGAHGVVIDPLYSSSPILSKG